MFKVELKKEPCDELGIWLRELTAAEFESLKVKVTQDKADDFAYFRQLALYSFVTAEGKQCFADVEEARQALQLPLSKLRQVAERILALSGLSGESPNA